MGRTKEDWSNLTSCNVPERKECVRKLLNSKMSNEKKEEILVMALAPSLAVAGRMYNVNHGY